MDWNTSEIVSFAATVTNIIMFLSGMQVIVKILKRRSSQGLLVLPFMSCFVCCTLWAKYGFLTDDKTVIYVNLVGSVIEALYTVVFYIYSKNKKKTMLPIMWLLLFLFLTLAYTKYVTVDGSTAIFHHGIICSTYNIFNYAAPLSAAASVIKKKSTESISLLLSFVYFLVALEWFIYGYIRTDYFMQVPNFIGIILGGFQLSLFIRYPPSKSRTFSKDRSSDIEVN